MHRELTDIYLVSPLFKDIHFYLYFGKVAACSIQKWVTDYVYLIFTHYGHQMEDIMLINALFLPVRRGSCWGYVLKTDTGRMGVGLSRTKDNHIENDPAEVKPLNMSTYCSHVMDIREVT